MHLYPKDFIGDTPHATLLGRNYRLRVLIECEHIVI